MRQFLILLIAIAIVMPIRGWDYAYADDDSCLAREKSKPSKTSAPPLDAGVKKVMDEAKTKYPNQWNKVAEAIITQLDEWPKSALTQEAIEGGDIARTTANGQQKAGDRDRFGYPLNPFSLMPGWATGIRLVLPLAVNPQKLLSRALSDKQKEQAFQLVANAYYMADDYLASYALNNGDTFSKEKREEYTARIGELWERNDNRLKLYFGADAIRPGMKAGPVRARAALEAIDMQLKDERIKKSARDLHELMQKSNSYYKNLTAEELECRIREAGLDDNGDKARSDQFRAERANETKTKAPNPTRVYMPRPGPQISPPGGPIGTFPPPAPPPTTKGSSGPSRPGPRSPCGADGCVKIDDRTPRPNENPNDNVPVKPGCVGDGCLLIKR